MDTINRIELHKIEQERLSRRPLWGRALIVQERKREVVKSLIAIGETPIARDFDAARGNEGYEYCATVLQSLRARVAPENVPVVMNAIEACRALMKPKLTPAQEMALALYVGAKRQEDEYAASVVVTPARLRAKMEQTTAAYKACIALGMNWRHGL